MSNMINMVLWRLNHKVTCQNRKLARGFNQPGLFLNLVNSHSRTRDSYVIISKKAGET